MITDNSGISMVTKFGDHKSLLRVRGIEDQKQRILELEAKWDHVIIDSRAFNDELRRLHKKGLLITTTKYDRKYTTDVYTAHYEHKYYYIPLISFYYQRKRVAGWEGVHALLLAANASLDEILFHMQLWMTMTDHMYRAREVSHSLSYLYRCLAEYDKMIDVAGIDEKMLPESLQRSRSLEMLADASDGLNLNTEILARTIVLVDALIQDSGKTVSATKRSRIVSLVYNAEVAALKKSDQEIRRIIDLAAVDGTVGT